MPINQTDIPGTVSECDWIYTDFKLKTWTLTAVCVCAGAQDGDLFNFGVTFGLVMIGSLSKSSPKLSETLRNEQLQCGAQLKHILGH